MTKGRMEKKETRGRGEEIEIRKEQNIERGFVFGGLHWKQEGNT